MGTILAILGTLGTIAATLGLERTIEYIDLLKVAKKGLDSNSVIKVTSQMINEAKSRGGNVLNKLNDKINAIQIPYNASGEIKNYFNTVKKKLSNKYKEARTDLTHIEDKLNTLSDQANNYLIQPDHVKNLMKSVPEQIKNDVTEQINKISEVEKKIYEK